MFGYAEERAGAALIAYGTLASLPRVDGGPVLILVGEVYREAVAAHRAARNSRQATA